MRPAAHILAGILIAASIGTNATAAVVAVVSVKNPVTSLTKNQITDIFLGRVSHFPDGTAATPVDLPEGSAERNEFYAKVTGKTAAQIRAYWYKIIFTGRGQPPPSVPSGAEIKKRLREKPDTIGYIDESLVDDSVRIVLRPGE